MSDNSHIYGDDDARGNSADDAKDASSANPDNTGNAVYSADDFADLWEGLDDSTDTTDSTDDTDNADSTAADVDTDDHTSTNLGNSDSVEGSTPKSKLPPGVATHNYHAAKDKADAENDRLARRVVDHDIEVDMGRSILTHNAVTRFLKTDEARDLPPLKLVSALIHTINGDIRAYNSLIQPVIGPNGKPKAPHSSEYLPMVQRLNAHDLKDVLLHRHIIVNIAPSNRNSDPELDMLAYYDDNPESETYGLYINDNKKLRNLAQQYNFELNDNGFKDILSLLRAQAPRIDRRVDKDLIAVNNGIFNYKTKTLEPFSPDYVFLSKSIVSYNPDATLPVITTPHGDTWDIESWMLDLANDSPELCETIWQIIGAIIRPYVSWNKAAWFYSEQGNNGKGTLVELMRNICGPQTYASVPLADFSKEFMLEPLTRAQAILVDENNVGTYIDQAANLKAIITNDVISINRKYRSPIAYQFYGFMVQCLNEMPRVRDRSESFYRRQLFVPFNKSFTGVERRYIKDEYMSRTDVLQYVLKRVLNDMDDYYELSEPPETQEALNEYRLANDPVRAFWDVFAHDFAWDALPYEFLYDLYTQWHKHTSPGGAPVGYRKFIQDIKNIAEADTATMWQQPNSQGRFRPGSMMSAPEPLIEDYGLHNWENAKAKPHTLSRCIPTPLKDYYRGLVRIDRGSQADIQDPADNTAANTPDSQGTPDNAADNAANNDAATAQTTANQLQAAAPDNDAIIAAAYPAVSPESAVAPESNAENAANAAHDGDNTVTSSMPSGEQAQRTTPAAHPDPVDGGSSAGASRPAPDSSPDSAGNEEPNVNTTSHETHKPETQDTTAHPDASSDTSGMRPQFLAPESTGAEGEHGFFDQH